MKNNDDFLSRQGTVYTLVDSEGYLVREDPKTNFRERYSLTDIDTKYQAGYGLELSGNIFLVDESIIPNKTEVNELISASVSGIQNDVDFLKTNLQPIKIASIASDYTFELEYEPDYEIFINEVTLSSNVLEIEPIAFTNHSLQNNQVATFESWIKTTNSENINTLSIDASIVIVDDMPYNLDGGKTHVFVRRVYKDGSGNIHEKINYSYSF